MRLSLVLALLTWSAGVRVAAAQAEEAEDTNTAAMEQAGEGMDDERGRSHFRAGSNLYDAGAFERAGQEFEEAYRLSGRPELLYNIYVAYRDAGEVRKAAEALRGYLEEAEQVQDGVNLEARLRSLEEQVAELDRAEQRRDERTASDPEGTTPPTGSGDEGSAGPGIAPWIVVGVGGAAVVAGVVTGVLALGAVGDIEEACPGDICPPGYDLEGERGDARTLVTVTDVLLLGGAVVALGGTAWLLFGGSSAEEPPPADVTAGCDRDGCMASVRGRF